MSADFWFGVEVFLNGLMAGVMYSLVALGFVLIFKASGIFNYAQGVMALFAAQTLVGLQTGLIPFSHLINALFGTELHHFGQAGPDWWVETYTRGLNVILPESVSVPVAEFMATYAPTVLAILFAALVMLFFAILVEKLVLKHLVNQEPIILFMATIGLAYFMEGFGELMWGSELKTLDIGIEQGGNAWFEESTAFLGGEDFYGFYLDTLDIYATVIAVSLVSAVADDHQAALSVGISLRTIWVIVWTIAGFVALVAGMMWGAKSGVQFSLSLIALKALPVLMLGGFTSIPGAIIGGLIIGVGEKMFEFLIGAPYLGGATENWFAYMLALLFLVFRPQGLFGEKIIERV